MGNFANVLLMILPMILAITLHEAAHAFAAKRYGDRTAEMAGRLTLNPVSHIDPMGTIAVPAVMFLLSSGIGTPLIFGWAKPVPIQPRNFRNVRVGMRMTALAGPLSNLVQMIVWAIMIWFAHILPEQFHRPFTTMCIYGVSFNAVLFALNIIPIPPLDGSRVVDSFLNYKQSQTYRKIEPYGTWIILFLLITGVLGLVLYPMVEFLIFAVGKLVGLF